LLAFAGRSSTDPVTIRLQDRESELSTLIKQSTRGDISLSVSIPTDLWPVHVDVSAMDIALINLAVNAREAMPNGGAVYVAAANRVLRAGNDEGTGLTGEFVAISFRDTGQGIPDQNMSRIFEPFFTTKERGTGLGLSQVYGFSKQAGGWATASSTSSGTTITLYLPRSTRAPQPSPAVVPVQYAASAGRGRALLIEDNAEVAQVVTGMLSDVGYTVSASAGAPAAYAALQTEGPFDLVLSDIVMEGVSGLEIAREIRSRYASLPVILMTGYSEALLQGAPAGIPVLAKPFSRADLEAAVQQVLSRPTETAALQ
jgi:two-component system NtrC family sensor kinase